MSLIKFIPGSKSIILINSHDLPGNNWKVISPKFVEILKLQAASSNSIFLNYFKGRMFLSTS